MPEKSYCLHRIGLALLIVLALGCNTTRQTSPQKLVELNSVIPDILLDIRYATPNNFTGQIVYPCARCFLLQDAAYALREVQNELRPMGYRLKVFDGYRPLSVQRRFWAILPDPRYVADPTVGSRHNRGCAVDLSLVKSDRKDVPMPTEFDDFTEKAHPAYMNLPEDALRNRALLKSVMERHGFTQFPTEWWHFDYSGWETHPVLDMPLESIGSPTL